MEKNDGISNNTTNVPVFRTHYGCSSLSDLVISSNKSNTNKVILESDNEDDDMEIGSCTSEDNYISETEEIRLPKRVLNSRSASNRYVESDSADEDMQSDSESDYSKDEFTRKIPVSAKKSSKLNKDAVISEPSNSRVSKVGSNKLITASGNKKKKRRVMSSEDEEEKEEDDEEEEEFTIGKSIKSKDNKKNQKTPSVNLDKVNKTPSKKILSPVPTAKPVKTPSKSVEKSIQKSVINSISNKSINKINRTNSTSSSTTTYSSTRNKDKKPVVYKLNDSEEEVDDDESDKSIISLDDTSDEDFE